MLRTAYFQQMDDGFKVTPVVGLLGPRQCGKTTLARQYIERMSPDFPYSTNYFDLEDPNHLARLQNPVLALEGLKGLVVFDEIQRRPEIFPLLRVLVDRPRRPARFLILGSASRDLLRQSSETLAGRITYLDVHPFSLGEVGIDAWKALWLRGGFPPSFSAENDKQSYAWREAYVRTFLERDIPQLGIQIPAMELRRFWLMLTHYHGQIFQASEIGRSLGVADTTVRRYLDLLAGTLMIRILPPWYENIGKRQVKRPKIYFRDSGIYHYLLGIGGEDDLQVHPKLGASWEGFALEEILRAYRVKEEEAYFWSVHEQVELDLLLVKEGKRLGFEIKYSDTPKISEAHLKLPSLLRLNELVFVTAADNDYRVEKNVRVLGLRQLNEDPVFKRSP